MGVGKTAACKILKTMLDNCVFLDGDWCWDMHPFQLTEETKAVAIENAAFMLNNFLHCSAYENVVFCWVMQYQSTIDALLSRLDLNGCAVKNVSLVCDASSLKARLQKEIVRLEKLARSEKQPRKKFELVQRIKQLRESFSL